MELCCSLVSMLLAYGSVRAVGELQAHRYVLASTVSHFRGLQPAAGKKDSSSSTQHAHYARYVEDQVWGMLMLLEQPSRINALRSDPAGVRLPAPPDNYSSRVQRERCADCSRRVTSSSRLITCWASPTLGVILCSRCAYIHSTLPGDQSIIRHWIWDAWSPDEMEEMGAKDNATINANYQATMPAARQAKPDDSVEVVECFIRDKYESRLWVDEQREEKVEEEAAVAVVATSDVSTEMRSTASVPPTVEEDEAAMVIPSSPPLCPPELPLARGCL